MARIAMPVAKGFEDSEFTVPYERLSEAGHEVVVLGASGSEPGEELEGKRGKAKARVDAAADAVEADSFDALCIPGGWSPELADVEGFRRTLVRRVGERSIGKPERRGR